MKHNYDSRTKVVLSFAFVVVAVLMTTSALTAFQLLPSPPLEDWRLLDRVTAILSCAAMAAFGVLASAFFGIKHFTLFSRLDRVLTHVTVGFIGLSLVAFASYTVLTKVYNHHHGLLGVSDAALILAGSFLCFWVFLFYGRESSNQMR